MIYRLKGHSSGLYDLGNGFPGFMGAHLRVAQKDIYDGHFVFRPGADDEMGLFQNETKGKPMGLEAMARLLGNGRSD